ncbi:MAG TPA: AI-2E family transporter [Pseudomonadales bacterium]|nr:AI-2E family transporter [Pseudomonadales bacterium]
MSKSLAQSTFLLLLAACTALFGWLLLPFFSAILWATIIAVLFSPLQKRLIARLTGKENLVALLVLSICTVSVILPLLGVIATLAQEGLQLYEKIKSGELDVSALLEQIGQLFPAVQKLMARFGFDIASLKQPLKDASLQASRFIATQAFNFGQGTAQFFVTFSLTLYLAFFLLRDGSKIIRQLIHALPLGNEREEKILAKIGVVINATVRGGFIVAASQGALGGIILAILGIPSAFLLGVIMAFASLIPAVGATLIWGPVAVYFFATSAYWKGLILIGWGVGVIGLVDNLLRPLLVGRDTNMPDYLVLFSTIGGISLFGLNGFVIGPLIAAVFIALWEIFASEFSPL